MNSEYLAIIGFFVLFQVVFGEQPCVVEYENKIDSCYWGSKNYDECVSAKDMLKNAVCSSVTGDDCNYYLAGCGGAGNKLSLFKEQCQKLGGETKMYRRYSMNGKCLPKSGFSNNYGKCC